MTVYELDRFGHESYHRREIPFPDERGELSTGRAFHAVFIQNGF
jgi:hypothetical protein